MSCGFQPQNLQPEFEALEERLLLMEQFKYILFSGHRVKWFPSRSLAHKFTFHPIDQPVDRFKNRSCKQKCQPLFDHDV